MWIIYYDPNNQFVTPDKYTWMLVEDQDILNYQKYLAGSQGHAHPLQLQNRFLQHFVTFHDGRQLEYFARRYEPWDIKTQ